MHDLNFMEITGRITSDFKYVYKRYDENFYTFDLNSHRISGNIDTIKILVSDKDVYVDKSLNGLYSSIVGKLVTYNNKSENGISLDTYLYVDDMDIIDVETEDDDELIDVNSIELEGNICSMKPIRKTPLGRTICNIIIAINDDTCSSQYIPCIFWGRNAEKISMFDVGTRINIKGRFQSRKYTKNNNNSVEEKTAYEVSVQDFTVLV